MSQASISEDPLPPPPRSGLPGWWDRYFFRPQSARALAGSRIVFCGLTWIVFTFFWDFRGWDPLTEIYWNPVGVWKLYPPQWVWPDPVVGVAQIVFRISLLLGAIGLFTRPAMWVTAILCAYLLGVSAAFGKVSHADPGVIFTYLILAASRCGDAWSVDAWLARRRALRRGRVTKSNMPISGEYRWPIRAVWVVFTIVFALAGWQKLRAAGLAWVLPENFGPMIAFDLYTVHRQPPVRLAWWLLQHPVLLWVPAIATILGECLFPLALIHRRFRAVFVPLMFLMQINIWLLIGVHFWELLPIYAFWLPWDRLAERFSYPQKTEPSSSATPSTSTKA